jgi:hypothetical protein
MHAAAVLHAAGALKAAAVVHAAAILHAAGAAKMHAAAVAAAHFVGQVCHLLAHAHELCQEVQGVVDSAGACAEGGWGEKAVFDAGASAAGCALTS